MAYCTFMSGQRIVLGNKPGFSLVRVRETWRQLFSKVVVKVIGHEYTMLYQDNQLFAGIKAGTEGTVHGVQYIWDKKLTTEESGFSLVDARNAFNEINRVGMLWTFHHLWPSVACLVFNCYHH